MRLSLLVVCAFMFAAVTVATAQEIVLQGPTTTTSTKTVYGESIPSSQVPKLFSEAYPMAGQLLGQKVLVSGRVLSYCSGGCWIMFGDTSGKMQVLTNLTGLSTSLSRKTIEVYGMFEKAAEVNGVATYRFNAVSVRY